MYSRNYFLLVDSSCQRYLAPSNSVMTAFNMADRSSCSSLISSWNKETSFGIISWLPKEMILCSRSRSRWYNSSISFRSYGVGLKLIFVEARAI